MKNYLSRWKITPQLQRPQNIARKGCQHYADKIIAAINPIEPDDLPYIVAVLDLCSEKLKNDIDANMMEFTEALKKVFKPCFHRASIHID